MSAEEGQRRLVPADPTKEMIRAAFLAEDNGIGALQSAGEGGCESGVVAIYKAMLAAAPQPEIRADRDPLFELAVEVSTKLVGSYDAKRGVYALSELYEAREKAGSLLAKLEASNGR